MRYSVLGKSRQGRFTRQFILVVLLVLIAFIFIYPKPFNSAADYINSKKDAISQSKYVPFKNKGFNIWLKNHNIVQIPDKGFNLGLDLQGGARITYQIDTSSVQGQDTTDALESLRNIVENRVNSFGVAEPQISLEQIGAEHRLVVELAGIKDVKEAIKLIGQTPKLEFHEARPEEESKKLLEKYQAGNLDLSQGFVNPYYTELVLLTGKNLKKASVVFDSTTSAPQVSLQFDDQGTKAFSEATKRNIGKQIFIVLDDQIVSAPTVNVEIPNGNAVITGSGNIDEAKKLTEYLNAGALPLPVSVVEQQTVEASLGKDALDKSIKAATVGLLAIIVFMIGIYRLPGIVAVIALMMYTILSLAIFKLFGFTLTLSGIAGLILSIGIAVDGNVLIFERMKEELANGRSLASSVDEGFARAWTSIRDSHISTLISSFILFYLGAGVVKGFAITLSIGILMSLFSSITISRIILKLLVHYRMFEDNKILSKLMLK